MASVVLQPVIDRTSTALTPQEGRDSKPEPATIAAGTLLDGSFTFPSVAPGSYYVIAEKSGYLSPLSVLSRADLNDPTDAIKGLIAELLTVVTVAANRTATAEVTLVRGASIAGTVHFDDGAPWSNAAVSLLRKDQSGKWVGFRTHLMAAMSFVDSTDDRGRFRIVGMPAGEYLLKTVVDIHDTQTTAIFHQYGATGPRPGYTLDVFYGDTMRQRDAKPIKLADGQQSEGDDIEIQLAKLHSLSGKLTDAATGQTVNAGKVELDYPDDSTKLVTATVSADDDAFHFLYVPEGEYTLKVTGARTVTREEVSNCPKTGGCIPATHTKETTVQAYGDASQSVVVHGDATEVAVAVSAKKAAQ